MYDSKRTDCESKLEQAHKDRQNYLETYHWYWRENDKLNRLLNIDEHRVKKLKNAQRRAYLEFRGCVE